MFPMGFRKSAYSSLTTATLAASHALAVPSHACTKVFRCPWKVLWCRPRCDKFMHAQKSESAVTPFPIA
uniref:Putative secreted protein n=1 Tax=Ixodes ricinus TaxID=34613 RepID=A0A6B0TR94_IXORI